MDELAHDHEGGGEEQVEVHGGAALLGAASELAEAVHPAVGPLHDPARAGLDRGRDTLPGDGTVEAECLEQRARGTAVVATVEVDRGPVREPIELVEPGQRGRQQRRVVPVGAGRDQVERDPGPVRRLRDRRRGIGAYDATVMPLTRACRITTRL